MTNESTDVWSLIVFAGVVLIVIYKQIIKLEEQFRLFQWDVFLNNAIISICCLLSLIILVILIYAKLKAKREKEQEFSNTLNKLQNRQLDNMEQIDKTETELDKFLTNKRKLTKKYLSLICSIRQNLKEKKIRILAKEKQIEKEERIAQLKEERKQNEFELVLEYFKKKDSANSLPDWALNIDYEIVKKAVEEFEKLKHEQIKQEEIWEKVKTFIAEHKAYPLDFSRLDYEEQKMYKKAIRLLKRGKLEINKEIKVDEKDKHLIEKNFFHTEELTPEQRERFITQYGYRHHPFIFIDGRSGNNLIIRNDQRKESDYHFCMKHLFAELGDSIIEYSKEGMRADVVYTSNNQKIAIEIETGTNKEIDINKKVKWLNKNFDKWIFVVSRKNRKIYSKYADNKKSYCLTLKQAQEKIKELLEQ